ncbi:MAG: 3-phosphoshikimate 1-carboxyvinyltransferase [Eubacteriales bacterium]|nr:3-phosphoshikimate 1-carboxyvinyltransferase [Eubacteriales bacterium]MDD3881627.1 3-phosphoshikimate 1-carboxyvinyltransferase [Eubacteriales bacterium]MDD4512314.1 3-phosphoshikimate 1-carboxyvinyltransferase [Eubacteriales bacterium]
MSADMVIMPSAISGSLEAIPSKSACHRLAIAASLLSGKSLLSGLQTGDDVKKTLCALEALLRAKIVKAEDSGFISAEITGKAPIMQSERVVDCGESGSTLRMLLPLALDGCGLVRFIGHGRLMQRPMKPYEELCERHGFEYIKSGDSISVCGKLASGEYSMRGDVSSQFLSGMAFALSAIGSSRLVIEGRLESAPYLEMTLDTLTRCGADIRLAGNAIEFGSPDFISGISAKAEGDWSHAAFALVMGALGGSAEVCGLDISSRQGDKRIAEILRECGADVSVSGGKVRAKRAGLLKPFEVDASDIPDLVPILSVLACGIIGRSRIFGAKRLREKESDRLAAMAGELNALGAAVSETEDGLVIDGSGSLLGGKCSSHNDHRVAMSLCAASAVSKGAIALSGWEAVSKSAPRFFDEFRRLGGIANAGQ